MAVRGIDVSDSQPNVDWAKVAASGQTFGIAKATFSEAGKDDRFAENWPAIKAANLVRGSYHYFRQAKDGKKQAAWFLQHVTGFGPGDLTLVVDIEQPPNDGEQWAKDDAATPPARVLKQLQAMLDAIEAQTKRIPMIYTAAGYWNTLHAGPSFGRYPLWVANYRPPSGKPAIPNSWTDYAIWQNDDQGAVPGVTGHVDTNVARAASPAELLNIGKKP
jgi:lysozyme